MLQYPIDRVLCPQIKITMPRHLFKRYAPDHETVRNHKYLRVFGRLLHDPNLWHLNRRSVSGAFAIGLFWAFIPIPFQMVAAAAVAIPARVNLPLSVGLVWVSNPLTMPPLFYFTYRVGLWLLREPLPEGEFVFNVETFGSELGHIWEPLYLGSLFCGLVLGVLGYFIIHGLWRWHLFGYIRRRRLRRLERIKAARQRPAG